MTKTHRSNPRITRANAGLDRRTLMRLMGLGSSAAVMPSLWSPGDALANDKPPQRLIVFYTYLGYYFPECLPVGPDGTWKTATADNWDFGSSFAALKPFKHKIIFPNGVDVLRGGTGGAHEKGCSVWLSVKTHGTTVDQWLADKNFQKGQRTPLKTLDLTVKSGARGFGDQGGTGNHTFAHKVPLEPDPSKAFKRIFPGGAPTRGGGPVPPIVADPNKALRHRRRVFDFVQREFGHIKNKVSKQDFDRLQLHADLVRDQEMLLAEDATKPGMQALANVGCGDVDAELFNMPVGTGTEAYYRTAERHFTNIQSAFACDRTRVAMLNLAFPAGETFGWTPGMWDISHEHDFAHKYQEHDREYKLPGRPLAPKDKNKHETLGRGYRVHAELFAQLLEKLEAVKEADGSTLLDNSAVVWANQLATGLHSLKGSRWLIAGGLGGKLKTGRYLTNVKGINQADFWSTVTDAMGAGSFFGKPNPAFYR